MFHKDRGTGEESVVELGKDETGKHTNEKTDTIRGKAKMFSVLDKPII